MPTVRSYNRPPWGLKPTVSMMPPVAIAPGLNARVATRAVLEASPPTAGTAFKAPSAASRPTVTACTPLATPGTIFRPLPAKLIGARRSITSMAAWSRLVPNSSNCPSFGAIFGNGLFSPGNGASGLAAVVGRPVRSAITLTGSWMMLRGALMACRCNMVGPVD